MAGSTQCATVGCGKIAKMQCPTCIKLKITDGSFFCSQECFKSSWATHKAVHKKAKEAAKAAYKGPVTWPNFEFTGQLRPWTKAPTRKVPESIARPDYADTGDPVSERNARRQAARQLSAEEIEKMRVVCRLGREVLDACGAIIAPGVTCSEIDRVCHEASVARDCYPSPLNYMGFPKSCCTSVNEVICHGIPDDRPLEEGDIVNVDITVYHKGYHGDLNETFLVGKVDAKTYELVKTTHECLFKAIAACKPGARYRDMGAIISKHAHAKEFSVVTTYCGHGINNLFHTAPNVPHYASNKAPGVMKPGHTFTIEPMINVGDFHDDHWPDNWTAVTADGKRSAQFEHTLLITEDGCEILTARLPTSPCGTAWFDSPEAKAIYEPKADAEAAK